MPATYYTVVYRLDGDKDVHDEWWRAIQPFWMVDGAVSVTTIAKADELTRLDNIREILAGSRDVNEIELEMERR
jgi:hypothetical protein